jgi:hypothetical protein
MCTFKICLAEHRNVGTRDFLINQLSTVTTIAWSKKKAHKTKLRFIRRINYFNSCDFSITSDTIKECTEKARELLTILLGFYSFVFYSIIMVKPTSLPRA